MRRKLAALALALVVPAAQPASARPAPPDETAPAAPAADASDPLAALAWMTGSWEMADGERRIEEHWTAPASNAMLGMGRTLSGGKMVFFEYLRIESRPDGIFYVAHPAARPGTEFKMTRLDDREVVFENPAHDDPKRIIYRRNDDGSMTARTDGGPGTGGREFPYRRAGR